MLNAIQQGILTMSTKSRLEALEAAKEDLEDRIAREKLDKPRLPAEFVTFWLERFRKLDVSKREHRRILIDSFINAIYLYDDKLVLTFNYRDGTKTITFDDAKEAVEKSTKGSDLDCSAAPLWDADFAAKSAPPFLRRGRLEVRKTNCPRPGKRIWRKQK